MKSKFHTSARQRREHTACQARGVKTDTITFDVGAGDFDGVAGRDTTGALVNGHNMKVEVTRLADPMNPTM